LYVDLTPIFYTENFLYLTNFVLICSGRLHKIIVTAELSKEGINLD